MKKLIALLALVAAAAVMTPQTSEARSHHRAPRSYTYVSGYTSCGCPVYSKRVFCHYNRYGIAVFDTHRLPVNHKCHQRRYSKHRHHDHRDHRDNQQQPTRQYRRDGRH